MRCTQEQLASILKKSWSYESRAGWDAEELTTEFIGTVQRYGRLYDLYVDTAGNYWYTVRIVTQRGIVSEYESIFGYPEHERRNHRRESGGQEETK